MTAAVLTTTASRTTILQSMVAEGDGGKHTEMWVFSNLQRYAQRSDSYAGHISALHDQTDEAEAILSAGKQMNMTYSNYSPALQTRGAVAATHFCVCETQAASCEGCILHPYCLAVSFIQSSSFRHCTHLKMRVPPSARFSKAIFI